MKLKELVRKALGMNLNFSDAEVSGIAYDSRTIKGGEIFCCLKGLTYDGHKFAVEAAKKGAVCLVTERTLDSGAAEIKVSNSRTAMANLASEFYNQPASKMEVVGITGTNGKTSTAHFLQTIMAGQAINKKSRVMGTLNGALTTSEAPELQKDLAAFLDEGTEFVAMEVSSHALSQARVGGIYFDCAVFTNLGLDHLDYHKNQEAYFKAKQKLFYKDISKKAIVNAADEWGQRLLEKRPDAVGFNPFEAKIQKADLSGSRFIWDAESFQLPLPGTLSIYNAVTAIEAVKALGYLAKDCVEALAAARPIPGRFEIITIEPVCVVVDYAHTPGALKSVLESARQMIDADARLLVVFGCGGDRDAQKRPLMCAAAEEAADRVILTSCNSRSEDTDQIIADIMSGAVEPEKVSVRVNRREAIMQAINAAEPGDLVLIAGKGHETQQILDDEVIDFDDRQIAREILGADK